MSNSKNFMSIRSKLLAAVAMLLVASFMVVSSTYAWFTLSTAPEVTGITTQIGANGNLEIALNTGTEIGNYVGGANTNVVDKNKTWGNIINLADDSYGFSSITLKPAILSVSQNENEKNIVSDQPLITPVYGSDGRVESLSKNSFYGASDGNGGFIRNDNGGYGVRALGTVSNMTKQQLQYVTAVSAINASLTAATSAANISLRANGTALVELLLKGLAGDDTATFTPAELEPLGNMIDSLTEVPGKLETALKNYMLVLLSKANEESTDSAFETIIAAFNSEWDDIFAALKTVTPAQDTVEVSTELTSDGKISVPVDAQMRPIIAAYNSISDRLFNEETGAKTKYDDIVADGDPVTFEIVKSILTPLMNINAISVGEKTYEQISDMKSDKGALMGWAATLASGCTIKMPAGSGVYADIASVTDNISVSFTAKNLNVSVTFPGDTQATSIPLEQLPITMKTTLNTDATKGEVEINRITIDPTIHQPDDKEADSTAVISDTYAYVLDFAFRTNAANSNLLLQQSAKDRIYGSNTDSSAETWGGGSFMSFATSEGFADESILSLMENIRFVFVNTDTKEILAVGGLDTAAATSDGATVKAEVVLYEFDVTDGANATVKIKTTTGNNPTNKKLEKQTITALGQNQVTKVSVYVYLDGENVTNADVPSGADISGNLNLQFASDATLKPMDYADLQNQNATSTTASTAASSTTETEVEETTNA